MSAEVYGRCAHPREPECQALQRIHNPEWRAGKLLNRCRYCHGIMLEEKDRRNEGGAQ